MRRQASLAAANDVEAVGRPLLGRGQGVEAEAGAEDHAQRALGADEDLVEVGPDGRPGSAAGVDHPAVGQSDVEADGHVLDLAVAVGELAGGAAGQPAADGRQGDGLRPVAEGHARARPAASPRDGRRRCRPGRRGPSRSGRPSGCPRGRTGRGARPPWTGTEPPHTPLRPAAAVTGMVCLVADGEDGRRPPRRSAGGPRPRGDARPGRTAPRSWPAATSPGPPRPARRRRCRPRRRRPAGGPAARRRPRRWWPRSGR